MLCRRLRLHQCMGRILTRVENKFPSSSFSTHVHHKLALRKEIWMEFQRSFFTETGSQITTSNVIYPRGQRHVCAYLDGIPALRSQTRNPKNSGSYREQPMPSRTKRINRNTPTESVHSSGDTFIKPIITRSFRFITEKVSIFAKIKQAL